MTIVLLTVALGLAIVLIPRLADVTYPTQMELREIEQVLLPNLTEDDEVFDEFPIVEENATVLRWEQMDNYTGLQQARGYNGSPRHVTMVGAKQYEMDPSVFGDYITIDEKELTERRQLGEFDAPVSVDDLIGKAATFLLQRRLDRIKYNIWTLLSFGTFTVTDAGGSVMAGDSFPFQAVTAAVPWATVATATPMTDIRTAQKKYRGQSVDFGSGAKLYVNLTVANLLLANTNANDLFGRRINGGSTINNIGELNAVLVGNGLPPIVIYDKGYIDDTGTFQLFIPDTRAILIGRRLNGSKLGEYRMTRNANNANNAPGAYTKVVDHGDISVPRRLDVHDGHNGGPVSFFPGGVVIITVG